MAITLCSLPDKILFSMILIIGLLNLEFRKVHSLIFEDIDLLSRHQTLDKSSMSTESHFVVVSYQLSDTEDRSLHSHAVGLNCDFGTICVAFNMD